jgi:hypothetical protein
MPWKYRIRVLLSIRLSSLAVCRIRSLVKWSLFMTNVILLIAVILCSGSLARGAESIDGEIFNPDEAAITEKITRSIENLTAKAAAKDKDGRAHRDAHRKHHGCVKARFKVLPISDSSLAVGLFAESASYPAVIRFSNGSGQVKDDREGDGRGMAVKIMGVPGPKLQDDERETQDFLMINHPVFFVRDAKDYLGFQTAVASGRLWTWLLDPRHLFHETGIARSIQAKKMVNPLESRYWSMTASKIGSKQMKFSTRPCEGSSIVSPSDGSDRLQKNLEAHLASKGACFDFQVQLRTRPKEMPVEDPTLEWDESASPFVTVATITIPPQRPEMGDSCEALSLNPWHSLVEHRPLGSISRIRRSVYAAISRMRHEWNQQPRTEPVE